MFRSISLHVLTALVCLFWLAALAVGVNYVRSYGLYWQPGQLDEGAVILLLVPALMIAGTAALGYRARRNRIPMRIIVASTLVSGFGVFLCLAVLGRGV